VARSAVVRAARAEAPARERFAVPLSVAVVAGLQLAVLVATSTRYGYHRDEMYFIVAGAHPAWGYADQPALVPLLTQAMQHLAPGSLFVLRLPSAIAATVTSVIAALIAREVGGTARAQLIAAACTASSGFALAVGHFVTTTTFDLLSTSLLCWLLIRALTRRSGPPLLAAGVVAGIGFEAKPQVGFVAIAALVVLAIVGPRWPLRSPWLVAGVVAAVGLAAPYVIWQAAHHWPQLKVANNIAGSAEGGRAGFVPFQLVMVSPLLAPVWVAGLLAPWRRPQLRVLRFLPIAYVLLALAYIAGNGKAYYLASLYPTLLGVGALPVAEWTTRVRRARGRMGGGRRVRGPLLTAAIALSMAVGAYVALPLLPETSLQGSLVMGVNPDQGETVGWPRFIDAVVTAWQAVPAAERAQTVIVTRNYGEAGAVDLLGRERGLPAAYSGHNAFGEWGPPPAGATSVLLVGYDQTYAVPPGFAGCTTLATVDNGVGLDNDEQGAHVLRCRLTGSWASVWPQLVHYG
jgi:hypothetical protein